MVSLMMIRFIRSLKVIIVLHMFLSINALAESQTLDCKELLPMKLVCDPDMVITLNAESDKHNQLWYSIYKRNVATTDFEKNLISMIRILDSEKAKSKYDEMVSTEGIVESKLIGDDVEYCGFRIETFEGMEEETIFVYMGLEKSAYMFMGIRTLIERIIDLENYCGLTPTNS